MVISGGVTVSGRPSAADLGGLCEVWRQRLLLADLVDLGHDADEAAGDGALHRVVADAVLPQQALERLHLLLLRVTVLPVLGQLLLDGLTHAPLAGQTPLSLLLHRVDYAWNSRTQ